MSFNLGMNSTDTLYVRPHLEFSVTWKRWKKFRNVQ